MLFNCEMLWASILSLGLALNGLYTQVHLRID